MNQTRREIHLKQGSDISEIFGCYKTILSKDSNVEELEQVTLGVTEDRRDNTSQFDLAYVNVSGQKVLTAFDNASTATLLLRELVEEGKIEIKETSKRSKINGIGEAAKGELVEVKVYSRNKERSIVITAAVVDDIMRLPPKDEDRFEQLTK